MRPALTRHRISIPPPSLSDQKSDLSRLLQAIAEQHGLPSVSIGHNVLRTLPDALRKASWKPEVTIWHEREIIRVTSHESSEGLYGLAVDIGTTTVAGYLVDLAEGRIISTHALMNPQVAFGEDVMTRITYCNRTPGGENHLHELIIGALEEIIRETTSQRGIPPDDLGEVVIVGNTCMHHLLLGLIPCNLGKSPFAPAISSSYDIRAAELGLTAVHSAAKVYTLPLVSGFVGADTIGVLLSVEPWASTDNQLIMDIGTNGEIVLSANSRLLASSVATGPAFEGAHIQFGMRAASGAIDSISINSKLEVEYTTVGSEKPKGICGSGIISLAAELFARGIISRTGKMEASLITHRLRRGPRGLEFVIAWAAETAIGDDIVISQKDIENIQMAKAALYAGAKILMKRAGIERIDRVVLAGSFGSFIDPWAAYQIGMLPDCDVESISMVGNAAGDGAVVALLNKSARMRAEELVSEIEYVELTLDPLFEHEFALAMMFPHMKDTFLRL